MASIYGRIGPDPDNRLHELKIIGTHPITGEPVYAPVMALDPGSIGGGSGSAVTIADNADVAQGAKADTAWVSGDGTVISLLKKIASAGGSAVSVADGADVAQGTTTDLASTSTVIGLLKNLKAALAGTLAVSGTFWQAIQPVSGTFWQATQPVSGTFWQGTQPVSVPIPVPISDNAGSLTVDGTVTANPATGQGKTLLFGSIAQGAAGTTVLVAADATRKIKVVSYVFTMSLAGTAQLTGPTVAPGAFVLAANGGIGLASVPSSHLLETAVNTALSIVTTIGAATGHFSYYLEA